MPVLSGIIKSYRELREAIKEKVRKENERTMRDGGHALKNRRMAVQFMYYTLLLILALKVVPSGNFWNQVSSLSLWFGIPIAIISRAPVKHLIPETWRWFFSGEFIREIKSMSTLNYLTLTLIVFLGLAILCPKIEYKLKGQQQK